MNPLELIPVVDISHYNEEKIFISKITHPIYSNGTTYAKLTDILLLCKPELLQLVALREKEDSEFIVPLHAGFILKQDEKNVIYPGCCSDLSQIDSWELALSVEDPRMRMIFIGHPFIKIRDDRDIIEIYQDNSENFHEGKDCKMAKRIENICNVQRRELVSAVCSARLNLQGCEESLSLNLERSVVRALFGWHGV